PHPPSHQDGEGAQARRSAQDCAPRRRRALPKPTSANNPVSISDAEAGSGSVTAGEAGSPLAMISPIEKTPSHSPGAVTKPERTILLAVRAASAVPARSMTSLRPSGPAATVPSASDIPLMVTV